MTYLPGTNVQVDLGLAGDVVAEAVEAYGPPGQRRVLVRLTPELSGDLVAEPVVMSLPEAAVRQAQPAPNR
jgi:hypothetical protein